MIWRAAFRSTKGNLVVVNTLHFETGSTQWSATSTEPSPAALATELDTQLSALYRGILDTNYTLADITVTQERNPTDPLATIEGAVRTIGLAGTRAAGTATLPSALSCVVSLRTAKLGRSFRGRFFAPPSQNVVDMANGLWVPTGAYLLAVKAFMDKLDDTFTGGAGFSSLWLDTWQARSVIYSRTRAAAGAPDSTEQITGYVIRTAPAFLRSRRT